MAAISEKIAQRRKELGITQKELAEKLHVSDKTVSRWETGQQIPDALTIQEIANALGLTISEIYDVENKDDSAPCLCETPRETDNRKKPSIKLSTVAARALVIAAILLLAHSAVNLYLSSKVSYAAENIPLYRLTAYDHSILEWIRSCDEGQEEVCLLSRLKTDAETGQDILCYLVYVPQGYEGTSAHIQYNLGLKGKTLKFQFKNTAAIIDENYYLCYAEVPYDPKDDLYLQTSLNGKRIDLCTHGNIMHVNWDQFSFDNFH